MGSIQKRDDVDKRTPFFLDTNNLKNKNRADILKISVMNVNTTNDISFKLIVQFSDFLSDLISYEVLLSVLMSVFIHQKNNSDDEAESEDFIES